MTAPTQGAWLDQAGLPGISGVDVSSFQGPPGQWRAAAGAIAWAAVKLTELQPGGTRYVNPDAAADWAWLLDGGKARVAYLFAHPSVGVAETTAFFASEVRALGLHDADGIMVDLEVTDGLPPARVSAWGAEVMGALEAEFARRPLLYTYLSFAEQGNTAGLGGYPLWISDPSSPEGHPRVPPPWTSWAVHQYSTSGAIDRDVANYPRVAAMISAWGRHASPTGVHVADGSTSLSQMAAANPGMTVHGAWWETAQHRPLGWGKLERDYLQAGNWDAPLKAGTEIWG